MAYEVFDFQISAFPGWVGSDLYDIDAKMDKSSADELEKLDKDEKRHQRNKMLRELLVDRFKLRLHWETKEQGIYALVVANKGPKMHEAQLDRSSRLVMGTGDFAGDAVTMGRLAKALAEEVQRPVVDKTGLTAAYDFALRWDADEKESLPFGEANSATTSGESARSVGVSIFTAIQDQLGLKLVPQKAPVNILIIDQIEQPSEN
jgi:uncharacterized protein (TIGR03435 family)